MTGHDEHLEAIRMAKAHGGALFRRGRVWTFKDCPLKPGVLGQLGEYEWSVGQGVVTELVGRRIFRWVSPAQVRLNDDMVAADA